MSRGNIVLITKHKMRFGWPLRVTQNEHVSSVFRPPPLRSLYIERGVGVCAEVRGEEEWVPIL